MQRMLDALLDPRGEPASATVRVASSDVGWRAAIEIDVADARVHRTVAGGPCLRPAAALGRPGARRRARSEARRGGK
ncbi:MAG: hypothetical protein KDK70_04835, partial [Myxococcales bacterium]|nr:hypothetical protein [Myxococcales bacterium]